MTYVLTLFFGVAIYFKTKEGKLSRRIGVPLIFAVLLFNALHLVYDLRMNIGYQLHNSELFLVKLSPQPKSEDYDPRTLQGTEELILFEEVLSDISFIRLEDESMIYEGDKKIHTRMDFLEVGFYTVDRYYYYFNVYSNYNENGNLDSYDIFIYDNSVYPWEKFIMYIYDILGFDYTAIPMEKMYTLNEEDNKKFTDKLSEFEPWE